MVDEFDAAQRIAGFPLVSIKKALTWVGVMDDRDDLKSVGKELRCGPRQAANVLDELEEQGFVTKSKKRNQWNKTQKGHRLTFDWQPPRRFRPVIGRDDKNSPINQGVEDVPCLLFGFQDDEDVFEEARLHVLFWAEFEGDDLVEVNVFEPDDYDDPDSGGTSTRSVYLTPQNARATAAALQKAADMAEKEIARRAKHPAKRHPAPKAPEKRTSPLPPRTEGTHATPARPPDRRARAPMMKTDRDAVAATVAELRGAEKQRQLRRRG